MRLSAAVLLPEYILPFFHRYSSIFFLIIDFALKTGLLQNFHLSSSIVPPFEKIVHKKYGKSQHHRISYPNLKLLFEATPAVLS